MDLKKSGELLTSIRKKKGMTQKQVADILGVVPKTVSKWETGNGFPDTEFIGKLAKVLDVSIDSLLSGQIYTNSADSGNIKRTKFYVCENCGAMFQGTGSCEMICCGKCLKQLVAKETDEKHLLSVSQADNEYYITFNHEMTKEHYISFVSYVSYDKTITVRLYPEQDASVRIPLIYGGKLYFYCNRHGLFEYKINRNLQKQTHC